MMVGEGGSPFEVLEECKEALRKATGKEKGEIYERMGDAYKRLNKGNKALICYQEAHDAGNDGTDFIQKYAQELADAGNGEEAVELIRTTIKRTKDPLTKARLYAKSGLVSRHIGNYDLGVTNGKRALEMVSDLDPKDHVVMSIKAEANTVIGLNLWRLGRIDEAAKHLKVALDLHEGIEDRKGMADVLNHLGIMTSLSGDQEKALEYYERSRKVMDKARCYINIGIVKQFTGKYHDAENNYKMALTKGRSEGYKIAINLAQLNLADLYIDMGNASKARTWIDLTLKGYEDMDQDPRVAIVYETMARVLIMEKDLVKARAMANKALEISRSNRARAVEARTLHTVGLIESAEGDHESAKATIEKALAIMKEIKLVRYIGRCLMDLAAVYREMGLEEQARTTAAEARRTLEEMGSLAYLRKLDDLGLRYY
jgi:tetratricopeptide (TPR) repeat protein